ncbi:polysaccharide deacetylase family protein [Heliorestis convoluta]|uniref:Polysaccharide deacetylase family protein n=1 Tax=Heliorestis convoluta TaxID=356322 RepID=A0A5Q2N9W8_9FIRM|nr:polysaccharide deacetylase family protein [Heliorestis convoluta]QGG49070.1 polysaccharide deacetylase family protein [Heliorestis convoluta]
MKKKSPIVGLPLMKLFLLSMSFFLLIQSVSYLYQLAPERRTEIISSITTSSFSTGVVAMAEERVASETDAILWEEVEEESSALTILIKEEDELVEETVEKKTVYLTFDDGPSSITPFVLDILQAYNVPATFFVIGNQVERYPEIVQRMVDDGHLVGNHTYSHRYRVIYASPQAFIDDLVKSEEVLYNTIGIRPNIVRAPGGTQGNVSKALAKILVEQGYILHDWNVDSRDSKTSLVPAAYIQKQVHMQTMNKKSAVILFHDGVGKTTLPVALPPIIEDLQSRGFTFKTLDEHPQPITFIKME